MTCDQRKCAVLVLMPALLLADFIVALTLGRKDRLWR